MLVDGTESVPPGQGVVNVSHSTSHRSKPHLTYPRRWQRERWKCFSSEVMALFWCGHPSPSSLPDSVLLSILGIASFTGVTFLHRTSFLMPSSSACFPAHGGLKHNIHIIAGSSYESWVSCFSALLKISSYEIYHHMNWTIIHAVAARDIDYNTIHICAPVMMHTTKHCLSSSLYTGG